MADQENVVVTQTEQSGAEAGENEQQEQTAVESAEIARLKGEMAKLKAATDKATKEASDYKKQLRARQTAEEAAAEAEKERQDEMARELAALRKERTVAQVSKKVFAFVQDEAASNGIAEAMYGAEDADAVVDALNKAWVAREKSLRLEYGRVPAPGVGSPDGPSISREKLDGMGYKDRLKFAADHPDEYRQLMGR